MNPNNSNYNNNTSNIISSTKRRRLIIYKLLYKITFDHKPKTFLFMLSFIIKFWGMIIISHITEHNIYNNNKQQYIYDFVSLLRKLTFTQIFETSYINPVIYTCICVMIYLIYILSFLFYFIVNNLIQHKTIENKNKRKIICYYLSVINVYSLFTMQHIVEFLSIIIFGLFEKNNESNIGMFMEMFGNWKYLLSVLNFIFIICANIQSSVFMILQNKPFFSSQYPVKVYNETFLFAGLLMISYNFQGLQFITLILSSPKSLRTLLLLQLTLIIIGLIAYYNNYQEDGTFLSHWFSFILLTCCYSSFVNLFIPQQISISFHIESIIVEIIASFMTDYFIKKIINKRRNKTIRNMIFIAHKRRNRVNDYLTIVLFLKQYMTNIYKQEELYEIVQEHKDHCKAKKCLCSLFENVINVLSKEKDRLDEESHIKLFLHLNSELIAVLGKEISLLYDQISKEKSISRLKQITLLYVDFTFFFMSNINTGCYIVDKTLTKLYKKHKCGLIYGFTLFKLKKESIEQYKQSLIENGNDLKIQTKDYLCSNRILNFWNILKYQNVIFGVMSFIEKTTQRLEQVINYSLIKHITESQSPSQQKKYLNDILNFNTLYNNVNKYYSSHNSLIAHLKRNFSKEKKLLNIKTCYLTALYFQNVCNEIPKDIIDILINKSYKDLIKNSRYSFPETGFQYPLIMNYECDKSLSLLYICPIICKALGYKRTELIGQNINKFLPKIFWVSHQLLVQKSLLNAKVKPVSLEMFFLDKNNNYIPCVSELCHFPNLNKGVVVVMNVQPKEGNYDESYFVLDKFGNFITWSKTAENNFCLNSEIIEKNKFNFFNFFNLNQNITNEFDNEINEIEFKNKDIKRDKSDALKRNSTYKNKQFIYDKSKLKETFEKIKFYLQDSQRHFEIIKKLNLLEVKFFSFIEINPNILNNLEKNYAAIKHQLLLFDMELRKIDITPFYVVKVSPILPTFHLRQDTCIYVSSNKRINQIGLQKSGSLTVPTYGNMSARKKSSIKITENIKQKSSFFLLKNSANPQTINSTDQSQKDKTQDTNISIDIISNPNSSTNAIMLSTPTKENKEERVSKTEDVIIDKKLTSNELYILINRINSTKKGCKSSILLPCCIFIFLIVFHILFYYFIQSYLTQSKELFQLTHSLRTFEYMVILVSSLFLDGCISATFPEETENIFLEKSFNFLIHARAQHMFEDLLVFRNDLFSLPEKQLIDLVNKETYYYLLKDDWTIEKSGGNLRDMMLLFHFYIETIGNEYSITKCNISHYIYPDNPKGKIKPTYHDKLYTFITKNILGTIYGSILEIALELNKVSSNDFSAIIFRAILSNIFLLIIVIILLVVLVIIIKHYVQLIIRIIELIISKKEHAILYEKITLFKTLARELSLSMYSDSNKTNNLKLKTESFYNTASTQEEGNISVDENKQKQFIMSKSNIKASFDETGMGLLVMEVPCDKKEISNTLLKKRKQKDKQRLNNTRVSINNKSIFPSLNEQNDDDDNSQIKQKKINYQKHLKKSFTLLITFYIWVSFLLLLETSILIYSTFYRIEKRQNEKKSNLFGMSIIERGNYLILLSLSYKISIINFDPYLQNQYDIVSQIQLPNNSYNSYYNTSIEYQSSYKESFNSTFFGMFYELTELAAQKVNEIKLNTKEFDIFHNLRRINSDFDSTNFCFYIVKYYFSLQHINITSFEDFLIKTNLCGKDCRTNGKGINDEGLTLILGITFQHLLNNYISFMGDFSQKKKNNIKEYLVGGITAKVFHNLEYSVDKAHIVKIMEIKQEIILNYKKWKMNELLFTLFFIFIESVGLFFGFLFIKKFNIYYHVLYKVSKFIINALKK